MTHAVTMALLSALLWVLITAASWYQRLPMMIGISALNAILQIVIAVRARRL